MIKLVIGSTAMRQFLPNCREPKDLDTISIPSIGDSVWYDAFSEWLPDGTNRFATLDELYTLKISHSHWELKNGSWNKHMFDVVELKRAGAKLIPELYKLLYSVWEKVHGKKVLNLNQEKDDFFTDAVRRIYDHDSIHASVAYGAIPMYVQTLKRGSTVAVDMDYIKAMPFQDQIKLYREEIYATALERLLIPSNYKFSPHKAYSWAARRTITGLTKGWSSLFLIENYDIFRDPDCNYVQRHLENKHLLIPLEKECLV
jgi:hypothetical protein